MINPVIIHSCKYSANPEQNNERIPLARLLLFHRIKILMLQE